MPVYRYACDAGHEFETKADYDDDEVPCLYIYVVPGGGNRLYPIRCSLMARRQAVYRDQSVIFSGPGWTRSVVPPPEPPPPSSAGESTDVHAEMLDDFAKKQYEHDRNVRPYVKEAKKRGQGNLP